MGHLSTFDSVSSKLSCTSSAALESAPAATVATANDVNGNAFLVKRVVSNSTSITEASNNNNNNNNSNTQNNSATKQNHNSDVQISNGDVAAAACKSPSNGALPQNTAAEQIPPKKRYYFDPQPNIDLEKYTKNFKGDKIFGIQFDAPLKWDKVIQISLLHIVAVVALLTYPLDKLKLWTVLWSFFTGGLAGFGVTAGAHRFWTHRSYKANLPLRIILMGCFSLAGQNTLYDWVRDHRVHHKYSETDADPHNANRGFFFAHVGWLMMLKHPEVMRRGRQIDMSDILADPVVQFHQKYFIPLKTLLCFILPTMVPVYFWGEHWYLAGATQCLFRYVSSLNFTWSVNSAAHMWGTRPYDKRIMPSENIYVSICAMGEGWHNYHHVFPWDYKAAELGKYSVNMTTMILDIFQRIGWAWDMKQPSKELVKRTLEKYGDGTHESLAVDKQHQHQHQQQHSHEEVHGHCHYPEVPDPEYATTVDAANDGDDDDAESSSTESSKLDENDNLKNNHLKNKVAAT